jgi:hypothetical protein
MNLIDTIAAEMRDDDDDLDRQSELLATEYRDASPAGRELLDRAFACLCGWSLKTLLTRPELDPDTPQPPDPVEDTVLAAAGPEPAPAAPYRRQWQQVTVPGALQDGPTGAIETAIELAISTEAGALPALYHTALAAGGTSPRDQLRNDLWRLAQALDRVADWDVHDWYLSCDEALRLLAALAQTAQLPTTDAGWLLLARDALTS